MDREPLSPVVGDRIPRQFSTPTRSYLIYVPPVRLYADCDTSRTPFRMVRVVGHGTKALSGIESKYCPFLERTDPRATLWVFCQEFNGAKHVLEVRDLAGDGILWRELVADSPQIGRELFDHGRSMRPIPGTELKIKPAQE